MASFMPSIKLVIFLLNSVPYSASSTLHAASVTSLIILFRASSTVNPRTYGSIKGLGARHIRCDLFISCVDDGDGKEQERFRFFCVFLNDCLEKFFGAVTVILTFWLTTMTCWVAWGEYESKYWRMHPRSQAWAEWTHSTRLDSVDSNKNLFQWAFYSSDIAMLTLAWGSYSSYYFPYKQHTSTSWVRFLLVEMVPWRALEIPRPCSRQDPLFEWRHHENQQKVHGFGTMEEFQDATNANDSSSAILNIEDCRVFVDAELGPHAPVAIKA